MKRYMLTVAYDGTNYHGWQTQPNGITIESVLNSALTGLFGKPVTVIGASRTDAGVHSLGNAAVFDMDTKIPADKLPYALNQRLPDDIVIQDCLEMPFDFHPRYAKSRKTYEYKILNRRFPLPQARSYAYFIHRDIDVEKMRQAARYFVGEHDFKSFCSAHAQVKTTVRTIYSLTVEKEGDFITIRVTGSGFLYNMVRIISGTLLQVGIGERQPWEIKSSLSACDRAAAGPTAPAHGLTLVQIEWMVPS